MPYSRFLRNSLGTAVFLLAGAAQADLQATLAFDQPTGTVDATQNIEVWLTLSLDTQSDPLLFDSSVSPFPTASLPGPLPTEGQWFNPATQMSESAPFAVVDGAFLNTYYICSGNFTAVCAPGAYEFKFHTDDSNPARPSLVIQSSFLLLPGQSHRFLFGSFLPSASVQPGVYSFYKAGVALSITGLDALGNSLTAEVADIANTCPGGEDNCAGFSRTVTAVPEPGTYGLMALGVLGLAAVTRRRQA